MEMLIAFDDDVENLIRRAMRHRGQSFEQVVNEAVRRGLGVGQDEPFVIEARPLGVRSIVDAARLNDVGDQLEIERYQETVD
jgi:hypothetical protein